MHFILWILKFKFESFAARDSQTLRNMRQISFSASNWIIHVEAKFAMHAFYSWNASSVFHLEAIDIGGMLSMLEQDPVWSQWQSLRSERRSRRAKTRIMWAKSSRRIRRRHSRRRQVHLVAHLMTRLRHRLNHRSVTTTTMAFSRRNITPTRHEHSNWSEMKQRWRRRSREKIHIQQKSHDGLQITLIYSAML